VDELSYLLEGATRFASHLGVATALPDARMVAHQAAELDRFCASVDVMIGVNVIAFDQPFPGTKIRGLAEAAGMKLGADGVYRAMDENGEEMFCLTSLEKPAFSQESLRNLQTRGLTLTLDVPRAAHGKQAFERMLMMARQLAETLKGRVVDDNQAPLADAALAVIREQIGGYQKQMQERALPPGSAVALRVFS
jgi:FtsZ-interacting cell division protein ZipA